MDKSNSKSLITLIVEHATLPEASWLNDWDLRDRVSAAWDTLKSHEDLADLYTALMGEYQSRCDAYKAEHGGSWQTLGRFGDEDRKILQRLEYAHLRAAGLLGELSWFGRAHLWEKTHWPKGRRFVDGGSLARSFDHILDRYEGPRVDRAAGYVPTRCISASSSCREYKVALGRYLFLGMTGMYGDLKRLSEERSIQIAEQGLTFARLSERWVESPCGCPACGDAVTRYRNTNESWLYPRDVAERAGWFNPYAV